MISLTYLIQEFAISSHRSLEWWFPWLDITVDRIDEGDEFDEVHSVFNIESSNMILSRYRNQLMVLYSGNIVQYIDRDVNLMSCQSSQVELANLGYF